MEGNCPEMSSRDKYFLINHQKQHRPQSFYVTGLDTVHSLPNLNKCTTKLS